MLAFAWVAPAMASAAVANSVAGVVISAQGKPQLRKAGFKDFGPLQINDYVYEGDTLKTGEKDKVAIAFIGGAEVRLANNSVFLIEKGGGRTPALLQTQWGRAWTRMLNSISGIDIRTPSAVCAVRGTEADIESTNQLTVKVYDGHVNVYNSKGSQSLHAGQMTQVANASSAPQAPQQMGSQDKGDWQDSLKTSDAQAKLDQLKVAAAKLNSGVVTSTAPTNQPSQGQQVKPQADGQPAIKDVQVNKGGKKFRLPLRKKTTTP